jgi:hypothetical protein
MRIYLYIVSATSWTADEDFSILLDALLELDKLIQLKGRLLVVITGKYIHVYIHSFVYKCLYMIIDICMNVYVHIL